MGLRDLFGRAKKTVDDRGGADSLKEDAEELKDIARGGGSTTDKAKEAAEALKDPGAPVRSRLDLRAARPAANLRPRHPPPASADRPARSGDGG
jgi:hypothetical protein